MCSTVRVPADLIGGSEKVGSSERFLLQLGKLGRYVCPSIIHWVGLSLVDTCTCWGRQFLKRGPSLSGQQSEATRSYGYEMSILPVGLNDAHSAPLGRALVMFNPSD